MKGNMCSLNYKHTVGRSPNTYTVILFTLVYSL